MNNNSTLSERRLLSNELVVLDKTWSIILCQCICLPIQLYSSYLLSSSSSLVEDNFMYTTISLQTKRPTNWTGNTNKHIHFLTWHFKWYHNILWFLITLLRMPFALFAQFANENLLLLLFYQMPLFMMPDLWFWNWLPATVFVHYGAWCIALSINWVGMFWRVFFLAQFVQITLRINDRRVMS